MKYHETERGVLYHGDCLEVMRSLPAELVDCVVTSPPYWGLRDYGTATWEGGCDPGCDHHGQPIRTRGTINENCGTGKDVKNKGLFEIFITTCAKCGARRKDAQLGLEKTPEEYVSNMVQLFREVRRVLKNDGTLWLNLGDSYTGSGCGTNDYRTEKSRSINTTSKMHCKTPPQQKYTGLKPKDLVGIPWRVAFALQADGWYLRQDIIWHKPNPMPESVTDRCTKAHEYVFLMSKRAKYYYDSEAIKEVATGYDGRKDTKMKGSNKYATSVVPNQAEHTMAARGHERWHYKNLQDDGQQPNAMQMKRLVGDEYLSPVRNKRSVWTVTTKPCKEAHFATFPRDLIRPMIQAGCKSGGVVLDPFMGSGTTAIEAISQNKRYIGIDLNPQYLDIAARRIEAELDQLNIFTNKEIL